MKTQGATRAAAVTFLLLVGGIASADVIFVDAANSPCPEDAIIPPLDAGTHANPWCRRCSWDHPRGNRATVLEVSRPGKFLRTLGVVAGIR